MKMMRHIIVLALALEAAAGASAQEKKRNLLVIGQSKGYQHESISTAMVTLYNLGRDSGRWDTTFRTDCTAITKKPLKYEAKNLNHYDAVAFFTDGNLDMDDSQKADLLSFVRDDGKGFIGIHSAAITFLGWPEYGKMLGGYFDGHPWGQFEAPLVVEDPAFPGMGHFPRKFTLRDEIYQIKDYSRENVRVLLRLDAGQGGPFPEGSPPQGQGLRRRVGPGVTARGEWSTTAWDTRAMPGTGRDLRKMWSDLVLWSMGLIPGDATPRPLPAE